LATRHGVPADRCDVREGEIPRVIAGVAKLRRTDVLVMGVVSRSIADRAVIGSSAERVIDRVGCDLFVIKPAGFRAGGRRPARLPSP
jgi:universal stress protein E